MARLATTAPAAKQRIMASVPSPTPASRRLPAIAAAESKAAVAVHNSMTRAFERPPLAMLRAPPAASGRFDNRIDPASAATSSPPAPISATPSARFSGIPSSVIAASRPPPEFEPHFSSIR